MRNSAITSILMLLASCGPSNADRAFVEVRDSVGVLIIGTVGPIRADGNGWRVSEQPELVIGSSPSSDGPVMHWVRGVTRLSDGRIVSLSESDKKLSYFDEAGNLLKTAGRPGPGPGEFSRPFQLVRLSGDTVVVSERRLRRITWFSSEGELVRTVSPAREGIPALAPPGFGFVEPTLVLPPAHSLWRYGNSSKRPYGRRWRPPVAFLFASIQGESPTLLGTFPGPERYELDEDFGWLATFHRNTFSAFGGQPPLIFIGDSNSFEIYAFDLHGNLDRILRDDVPPDPISGEDIEWERSKFLQFGERMGGIQQWTRILEAMPLPPTKPAFEDLIVDSEGLIWAKEYSNFRPGLARWRIFSPEAGRVGTVTLPSRMRVLDVGQDYVLGVHSDMLDVETIRLFRLVRGGR